MNTPEEVTAALGAGWEPRETGGWEWRGEESVVTIVDWGGWRVHWSDGANGEVFRFVDTLDRAVAVALLLQAAVEVAGGAAVAGAPTPGIKMAGLLYSHRLVWGEGMHTAASLRRFALDLLRAAREAETTDVDPMASDERFLTMPSDPEGFRFLSPPTGEATNG